MAAAAIPLVAAGLGPILGKLLGGGKEPRLPQELESELLNLFHQAGSEAAGLRMMSAGLRNKLLAELEHRRTEGIGSPEFNIAVGEALSPNARQTQTGNRERQKAIEEQAGGIRKANDVYGDVSQNIDQYGQGINATGDSINSDIQGTFDRSAGRGDQASHEIVNNIGNTFGGAIKATSGAYGEFGKDTAGTYGGVRGMQGQAYDETGKLIESMDPSGMAAQARASRSFEPAMASMAMRLRKMGVDPGSPEFNAAMATVESDRARAMDDSSIGERDKYITAKSGNILGKADKLGGLDLANLKERVRLGETEAEIIKSLGLKQGDAFGQELVRNLKTQNELDDTRSVRSIANQNKTQENSVDYWNKKINAPMLQTELQRKDLQTATEVANRGDKTAATNLEIDEGLATKGTNYHVGDLKYRDDASEKMGEVGNTMFNQGTTMSAEGNRAVNTAFNQPEPQGSGWEGAISGGITAGGGALGKILKPTPKSTLAPGYDTSYEDKFFKAAGGPVDAGMSYTVGEKGPEKFVPNQPGTVVPNPASVTPGQPGAPGVPYGPANWSIQGQAARFNTPAPAPAAPAPAAPAAQTNPNTVPGGPPPPSNYGTVNPQYNPTDAQREGMRGVGIMPPGESGIRPIEGDPRRAADMVARQLRSQGLGGAPIGSSDFKIPGARDLNSRMAELDADFRRRGPAKGAPAGYQPPDLSGRFDVPNGIMPAGESSYGPATRSREEAMNDIQNFRGRLDPTQDDPRLADKVAGGEGGLMADYGPPTVDQQRRVADMDKYMKEMSTRFDPNGADYGAGGESSYGPVSKTAGEAMQNIEDMRGKLDPVLQQRQDMAQRRQQMMQRRQMQEMLNRRRPPRRPLSPIAGPGSEVY